MLKLTNSETNFCAIQIQLLRKTKNTHTKTSYDWRNSISVNWVKNKIRKMLLFYLTYCILLRIASKSSYQIKK